MPPKKGRKIQRVRREQDRLTQERRHEAAVSQRNEECFKFTTHLDPVLAHYHFIIIKDYKT